MNLEFEVKTILRGGGSPEEKVNKICSFTTFKKEDVINTIKKGGEISEIYGNIISSHKIQKTNKNNQIAHQFNK